MAQAKQGDKVRIEYTGTLDDGTIFDTTLEDQECSSGDCHDDDCGCETGPVDFVIGSGEFIPQIEEALVGMAPGEKKTVHIAADDAFGSYDEEKVFTVGKDSFPEGFNPSIGDELLLSDENEEEIAVTVVEVGEEDVTFDANHPLAGEDLTYEFQLVEIL